MLLTDKGLTHNIGFACNSLIRDFGAIFQTYRDSMKKETKIVRIFLLNYIIYVSRIPEKNIYLRLFSILVVVVHEDNSRHGRKNDFMTTCLA